jgi:hypothetical protein|tara:strand:+ start:859 stop:1122 length:264 start_codon:yes stop_codon:yes gene_type:complete
MLKPLELKEIITTTKDMRDALEGIYDWEHQRMSSSGQEEIEKVWKIQLPNLEKNIQGLVESLDEDYRERKEKALKTLPTPVFGEKRE